jgi:hypothetical protein
MTDVILMIVAFVVGAINWRWGYAVGRQHGREWGARR